MPGDVARQHARIGGMHVAGYQRRPDPRQGLHGERLEDGDMAVTAADQDQIP